MPSDTTSAASAQHWYLIALDGDMILKLGDSLTIGEDAAGELEINPAPGRALLRLTVEASELSLQVLALDMTLAQRGYASRQHLAFRQPTAVKLELPNNALHISPEFARQAVGLADRELRVVPTSPPTLALARLPDPIILREPGAPIPTLEVEPELQPDSGSAPGRSTADGRAVSDATEPVSSDTDEHAGSDSSQPGLEPTPDELPRDIMELIRAPEPADDPRLHGATAELPAETLKPEPVPPVAARDDGRVPAAAARRTPAWRWSVLAGAAVLGLIVLTLPRSRPIEAPTPVPVDARAVSTRPAELPAAVPARTVSEPPVAAEATVGPGAVGGQVSVEPSPVAAPDPFEPLLDEAERLLASGTIITPGRQNAVRIARDVLAADPDNVRAGTLLDASAIRLVEQARTLHAAGEVFEARNLLEDVRDFHPRFEPAAALLAAWSTADGADPAAGATEAPR